MTIATRNRPYCFIGIGMIIQLFLLLLADYPVAGMHRINNFSDSFLKIFLFPNIPTFLFLIYMSAMHPKKRNMQFLSKIFISEGMLCLFMYIYHMYTTFSAGLVLLLMIPVSVLNYSAAINGYRKKLCNGYVTGKQAFYLRCYLPLLYTFHKAIQAVISLDILSVILILAAQLLIMVGQITIMKRAKFKEKSEVKATNTDISNSDKERRYA